MIMSSTNWRSRAFASRLPVRSHLFAIGQPVQLKSTVGTDASLRDRFRVLATMPAWNGSPQYRIRNEAETHDRVTAEDMLEATPVASADKLFT